MHMILKLMEERFNDSINYSIAWNRMNHQQTMNVWSTKENRFCPRENFGESFKLEIFSVVAADERFRSLFIPLFGAIANRNFSQKESFSSSWFFKQQTYH